MKWMVASDIHGSEYYARKLVDLYKKEGASKLLLLGDILYHGPRNDLPLGYRPKGVIELLNPLKKDIVCVRGNCEAEVDQMVLEFPVLTDHVLIENEHFTLYLAHGHHECNNNPPLMNKDFILLCGHTHVPKLDIHDSYVYINPGSITLPKEDSWHGYMLIEDNRFIWKDVEGNIKKEYTYNQRSV